MKKIICVLLLAVLTLSVFAACAPEKTDWEYIEEKGTFVLGFDDAFPPMGFKDEAGNYIGFDIDVAKEVCKKLNLELKLQPIVWDSKELELSSKNIDCIWNGFTVNDERAKVMNFSMNYMQNSQVVVVKADSEYTTIASLAGVQICAQKGSTAIDAIAANDSIKNNSCLKVDSNVAALSTELAAGTVQAVILDKVVADYQLKNLNKDGIKYRELSESLMAENYAIAFRKGDDVLTQKVNDALKALKEEGKLAEISTKWFGSDLTTVA